MLIQITTIREERWRKNFESLILTNERRPQSSLMIVKGFIQKKMSGPEIKREIDLVLNVSKTLPGQQIPIGELLTTALNWIEDRIQPGRDATTLAFQHQLRECEPIAVAACHQLAQKQAVEIYGPLGSYPLAVGLSLISTASGKPWGFAATPQTWSDDDWRKVTETVADLNDSSILYRTGFKKVGISPMLSY